MDNMDNLKDAFADALGIDKKRVVNTLEYNTIPEWDSVAHMSLIAEIEERFDVMLDTDDIINMSSPAKAIEILEKYEVKF